MDAGTTSSGGRPGPADGMRVRDVVRDVVAEVAPEESAVVQGLARFDDDTVVRRLARSGGRREPLGFGVGEIAALVTPVVWLVVDEAAKRAAESAVDGAARGTKALLRRVMRRPAAPVVVPALTREQLREVRQQVRETAEQRGLEPERAAAIADAVVVRMALAAGDGDEPPLDADGPAGGDGATAE
ncbi:hypothetical protein [Pseudonocardia adelaidensis]|uniref:hypothetical protein n=1 Tax=Pseudonocardia adelaidensis TaxID=648754 RepID=UPI0031E5359B